MLEWFWDYSDTFVPLLAILSLLALRKKSRQDHVLLAYSLFCVFLFGFSNYLADRGRNNMVLYHIFSLAEFMVVMRYAWYLFSGRTRKYLLVMSLLYAVYWAANISMWEPHDQFNSNSASIACLLILIVFGLYFLSLSGKEELLYFQKLPQFWVATGFLFYGACSIPVVLAYKYKEIFYDLDINTAWKIQVVANCIKFVLISYASLCSYKYRVGLS
jgi:hypothetical protein